VPNHDDKEPIDWPVILGILLAVFAVGLWLGMVMAGGGE